MNTAGNTLLPTEHRLHVAYPNPFNPVLNIPFDIGKTSSVNLNIFDTNGRLIETLIKDQVMIPGSHTVEWIAESHASGVYFYSLTTGEYYNTKKVILIK